MVEFTFYYFSQKYCEKIHFFLKQKNPAFSARFSCSF